MISRRKFIGFLAALPGVSYAASRVGETAPSADLKITHAKIHPAIGIARVGNSRDEYFIGPEVPEAGTLPPGSYKDKAGMLKRQVARFRIYGYNAAGEVVRELTADNAAITWTAYLANKKGSWYEFQLALDSPEALRPDAVPSKRRNAQVTGADRQKLVIDPGPRSIQGKSTQGETWQFNNGKFFDLMVPLGELRTDEEGRLLVFGGHGLSRSMASKPPVDFANNDGWHDDTSDGPVDAKVVLGNQEIPVEGAWVVVAPPNYAPGIKTVRTMHDFLYDCGITWGLAKGPEKVSFTRQIAPIFRRLTGLQWVNQGFATVFGFGAPYDADQLLPRLADASADNQSFRQQIYARFRNPNEGRLGKSLWPSFYGDGWDFLTDQDPDVTMKMADGMARLSDMQLLWLKKWATGEFINDWAEAKPASKNLAEWPLAEQPAALDEAALAYCVADAFHPGCEMTWPVRRRSLYSGALRIRRRPQEQPEPDYGYILTPRTALADTGPLSASGPGDLTRWMAVPWQTDTATCLWSYDFFKISESLPTFWPARVPNQVLSEADYNQAMNADLPVARRQTAFATRRDWFRGFPEHEDIVDMVNDYHKLGIVEERPGVSGISQLPGVMFVESHPALPLPENVRGRRAEAPTKGTFSRLAKFFRKAGRKSGIG